MIHIIYLTTIFLLILLCFVIDQDRDRAHEKADRYYDMGVKCGQDWERTVTQNLRYDAVEKGYAEWEVTDNFSGTTKFKWK